MSNGQEPGGGKPPQDDRTLLDPLSNDELRALREARQRMQAKKESGSAVAHQIVIGPDSGEDIGDAPTRAMPSLPSFEGNVSLDQISAPPGVAEPTQRMTANAQDPATQPSARYTPPARPGVTPADPMSVMGHRDTVGPSMTRPAPQPGRPAGLPSKGGKGPTGQPGFGENTLLWMQPPKQQAASGPVSSFGTPTGDFIPRATPREILLSRLKTFGAIAVGVLVVGGLLYSSLVSAPKGVIELHSNPPKADVFIDGAKYEQTPVKLTLAEGSYRISLKLTGYETSWFTANVKGEQSTREDIHLVPISRPGLMTVKIEVKPVAARITVDGQVHEGKRVLMVPNVDPQKKHKILLEAGGFVKVVHEVKPEKLKSSYSFVLEKSSN